MHFSSNAPIRVGLIAAAALAGAAGCGKPDPVSQCIQDIDKGAPNARLAAEERLYEFGDEVVPKVCQAFDKASPSLKLDLVRFLSAYHGKEVQTTFAQALHDGPPEVARAVAEYLGESRSKSAEPDLLNMASNGPTADRRIAIRAVAHYGDHDATNELVQAARDQDKRIRLAAAGVLDLLPAKSAEPTEVALLSDADESVRLTALMALSRTDAHSPRLAQGVADAVRKFPSMEPQERAVATQALGYAGTPEADSFLVKLLWQPDTPAGTRALAAFEANPKLPINWPDLLYARTSPNADTRMSALRIAAARKMPEAVPALIALADAAASKPNKKDDAVQIAELLREIGDKRAVPTFKRLLGKADIKARAAAAAGLLAAGEQDSRIADVQAAIARLANGAMWADRARAATLCTPFANDWSRELLKRLAADRTPYVRAAATD